MTNKWLVVFYFVALLGEFCTTDDMCAAVENGLCINNVCQCGKGYLPDGEQGCISKFYRTQNMRCTHFHF